ncbi:hypothetical protein MPC4_400020 [Methylocella tundrae]|uniref:Uncharacterized protein n=1 Tax=Methylocella tundrae TaxID=227605 RepID=A0A8B6MBH7_METTU|nr:hypothetical protein MPC1_110022 [Methylocella tundrae]VTZ51619.1 hypothetical protein MPC4_400020 [Methylocella tundrae]
MCKILLQTGLNPRAMLGSLRQPFNLRVDELIRFKPCPPAFIFGGVS